MNIKDYSLLTNAFHLIDELHQKGMGLNIIHEFLMNAYGFSSYEAINFYVLWEDCNSKIIEMKVNNE